jgi:imidazoleglycerol-phosphate dehydratase
MDKRTAQLKRKTRETDISIKLNIDGTGRAEIATGIGFLDHMLELMAYHGLFDLKLKAKGDLHVDTHHTNEDIGIVLGSAFKQALKNNKGINRFGESFVPMDEALARVRIVLDISKRPSLHFYNNIKPFKPSRAYSLNDCQEFLRAFTLNSGINMHVDIIRGRDAHHVLESVFKALGRALAAGARIEPRRGKKVPSTKGRM